MKLQQMIAAMRAGGASNDVILASIEAAVAADAQELDKRKSQAADRQQRYMARKRGLTSADVSSRHLTSADVADASAYVSKRQSRQEPVAADDFGPATRVEDLGVPSSLLPKVTLEEEGR